jgi:hypothetical protein
VNFCGEGGIAFGDPQDGGVKQKEKYRHYRAVIFHSRPLWRTSSPRSRKRKMLPMGSTSLFVCGEGGIAFGDPRDGGLNKKRSTGTIVPLFFIPVHFGEQVRPVPGNEKCSLWGALLFLFAERGVPQPIHKYLYNQFVVSPFKNHSLNHSLSDSTAQIQS